MSVSSGFDASFGPNNVSSIYILKVPAKYNNVIEQDCIAHIPQRYCLNTLAGGAAIDGIHSENYNPSRYKCSESELEYYKSILKEEACKI